LVLRAGDCANISNLKADDHPRGWFFVVRVAAMVFGLCIKKAKKEVLT